MTQWLSAEEAAAWEPFVVSTLHLFSQLDHDLQTGFDITHLDYGMLAQLSFRIDGRMRMAELAATFGVARTMVSYRIKRLEGMGLVARTPAPDDGRGVLAQLTHEGKMLLSRAAPAHVEAVRRHFIDHLAPDELDVIGRVFTRLRSGQGAAVPVGRDHTDQGKLTR